MSNKTYNQACSLAIALDVIGERWTWLVLRALLTGPKRFGDLSRQLPAMGTNLLARRLRTLADRGVIEKSVAGRQSAYQLTAVGEQLRPLAHQLIRWGRNFRNADGSVSPPPADLQISDLRTDDPASKIGEAEPPAVQSMPEWDMLAIEAAFVAERAEGVQAVLQLSLSGFTFHLVIRNQVCRAITGPAVEPDATIISDSATLMAINANRTSVQSAEEKIRLKILGDRAASNLLFELFE